MIKEFQTHFNTQNDKAKKLLTQIYNLVKSEIPDCTEHISYGIPTFKYKGKFLVHIAGYENHIGIYPGSEAVENVMKSFQGYKYSKGTIQLPLDKELEKDLIKDIIQFRKSKIDN